MLIVLHDIAGRQDGGRLYAELTGNGHGDIRTMRMGSVEVLMAPRGDQELADHIRTVSPSARILSPAGGSPLAERSTAGSGTSVPVGPVRLGGERFVVAAGPCAVESLPQLKATAAAVQEAGATILRGGAFKPRTSPHAFQGLRREGAELLDRVRSEFGLPVVSEVVDPREVDYMADRVDMVQIGTRNAQNYALLTEVGRAGVPVLLERGFGCTVEEWLGAAEYILQEGNSRVVLCERGIRSYEPSTRFTLDLAAVAVLKNRTHLPVIVDPSHSVGHRELVVPMALAAAAAGADGLIVDVHVDPASARCDGPQALPPAEFGDLMTRLSDLLTGIGRPLARTDVVATV